MLSFHSPLKVFTINLKMHFNPCISFRNATRFPSTPRWLSSSSQKLFFKGVCPLSAWSTNRPPTRTVQRFSVCSTRHLISHPMIFISVCQSGIWNRISIHPTPPAQDFLSPLSWLHPLHPSHTNLPRTSHSQTFPCTHTHTHSLKPSPAPLTPKSSHSPYHPQILTCPCKASTPILHSPNASSPELCVPQTSGASART